MQFKKYLKIRKFIIILLFLVFNTVISRHEKYVIGTSSWGFFACFFNTLNHIAHCVNTKKIPVVYWGPSCPYFDPKGYEGKFNAWEYYFEPVSDLSYRSFGDVVHGEYLSTLPLRAVLTVFAIGTKMSGKFPARYEVKRFIDKYIRIKPKITKKANEFYFKNIYGKPTVGIHLRGTDKKTEIAQVDPAIIIAEAKKLKGYQYFIATDDEKLLQFAKDSLKGSNIIYYNSYRSKDGQPVHFHNDNKGKAGEDILIEAILLASCNKFIHTNSNVSMAVLCFNPDLDNIVIPSTIFIKK